MKGVLFHQDNAQAHKSVVAMAPVRDCGVNWLITLHILLIWHHLTSFVPQREKKRNCPSATRLSSSVFQAIHEMPLLLLFKVLNCLSSMGLSGRKQCS